MSRIKKLFGRSAGGAPSKEMNEEGDPAESGQNEEDRTANPPEAGAGASQTPQDAGVSTSKGTLEASDDVKTADNAFRGLGRRLEPYAVLAEPLNHLDSAELRQRLTDIEKCKDMFTAERRDDRLADSSPASRASPSRIASQESGVMFCRICRESEDSREAFVTPCRCRGSVARVHVSCLERWLAESDTSCCELCGHQYITVRTPKYNVLSSIPAWLASTSNTDMMFDLAAFCVFTPVAFFGTYLGVNAGDNAYLQMSLMAAIDLVYSAWLAMRLQYHASRWYAWWRRKSIVKIILDDREARRTQADLDLSRVKETLTES